MIRSQWTVRPFDSSHPIPRHGHQMHVLPDEKIIVFGGGSAMHGIDGHMNFLDLRTNSWSCVPCESRRAAAASVQMGSKIILFAGMAASGNLTNDLFVMDTSCLKWNRVNTVQNGSPCPRLGHSLTLVGDSLILFAGLGNQSDKEGDFCGQYLNDVYLLRLNGNRPAKWTAVSGFGSSVPCVRESHSAVAHTSPLGHNLLIVFGGMSAGRRLSDLWIFNMQSKHWIPVNTDCPAPGRSLHSAAVINDQMIVFGGWMQSTDGTDTTTNDTQVLNLKTMEWHQLVTGTLTPSGRAGHSCVVIDKKMIMFGGRSGDSDDWDHSVWCLLTQAPQQKAQKIELLAASSSKMVIQWPAVPDAEHYIVQIQKVDEQQPVARNKIPVIRKTNKRYINLTVNHRTYTRLRASRKN